MSLIPTMGAVEDSRSQRHLEISSEVDKKLSSFSSVRNHKSNKLSFFQSKKPYSTSTMTRITSNFFSLTNILLTSSFLYALTNAAPIPKALDATAALLTSRHDVLAVKSRFSPLDNMRMDTIVLPSGRSSRILPRTPYETSQEISKVTPASKTQAPTLPRKIVDRRGEMRFSRRSFTPTFEGQEPVAAPTKGPVSMRRSRRQSRRDAISPMLDNTRIGTVVKGNFRQPILPKNAERSEQWEEAVFDPREAAPEPSTHIENSPIGPTKLYSGKLWRRGLKRTPVA
jgi:hypothetical protein